MSKVSYPEGRVLFVASTGGHLSQLVKLGQRFANVEPLWVTFDTPQSRGLLKDQEVFFVPYIAPRDFIGVLSARRLLKERLRDERLDGAVSTGAALSLAALPLAKTMGASCLYIESISRFHGPSLSGKILQFMPGIETRTQHKGWSSSRWKYEPPILEEFRRKRRPPISRPKLFVTLGTIKPYRFDALIDSVLATGLVDDSTVWQVGETTRYDLPGRTVTYMESAEFTSAAEQADVVVTHSGVGTILELLDLHKFPLVIPRRAKFGEHVDDHQVQIAEFIQSSLLGFARYPEEISATDILEAAAFQISPKEV